MIKMVVFDMAGTTIQEDNLVYKTIHKTFEKNLLNLSLDQVLSSAAGKEKKEAIKDLYKIARGHYPDTSTLDSLYIDFSNKLEEAYDFYPISTARGLQIVFEYLKSKHIKIVLNTGYNVHTAKKILAKTGLEESRDFDLLVTADMVNKTRPEPDMINFALDTFKIAPIYCIKIGDSTIDIQEGFNAGCRYSIGITGGAQTHYELATVEPSYILDELEELIPLVKKFNESA